MTTTIPDILPEYAALGELPALHQRVGLGIIFLQINNKHPRRFDAGAQRLIGLVAREYLPGLRDLVEGTDPELLRVRLADIEQRLGIGYGRKGAAVDARWLQLLCVYEVLSDALQSETYLTALCERIDGIRALQAGGVVAQAGAME